MQLSDQEIFDVIYQALRELNEMRSSSNQLACEPSQPIAEHLDSLGFVNLMASLEERIHSSFGAQLVLATEAEADQSDHFASVATLASFIRTELQVSHTH